MSANVAAGTLQINDVSEMQRPYQPANKECSTSSLLLPTAMAYVRVVNSQISVPEGREGQLDHAECIPFGLEQPRHLL
jgi:hypothetical protein